MKKIPTLFVRNRERHLVSPAVTPGCEWVLEGEGRPTRKVDGTAVLLRNGTAYKRRTIKPGKTAPAGFEEADHDPATGKRFGWMPIDPASAEDELHVEAIRGLETDWRNGRGETGTYELVGPKVQGNTESLSRHALIRHDVATLGLTGGAVIERGTSATVAFNELADYLRTADFEGIVWHHEDGRRAKLKRRDFGLPWPIPDEVAEPAPAHGGEEMILENQLERIADMDWVRYEPENSRIVHETVIEKHYPDIDIPKLLSIVDEHIVDDRIDWTAVIDDYAAEA